MNDNGIVEVDLEKAKAIGDNVHATVVAGMLILIINPDESIGRSNSHKMMGVASTQGLARVPCIPDIRVHLYIGRRIIPQHLEDEDEEDE